MSYPKLTAQQVIADLKKINNPDKANILARFFKTGPGEYGEGDIFWGITVPEQRSIAKKYLSLDLIQIEQLLKNPVHEIRLTGALILVEKFNKSKDDLELKSILDFYLNNLSHFNNWDLVDLSAPKIIGSYLVKNPDAKKLLSELSKDSNFWIRRVAMVANLTLIRSGDCQITISLARGYLTEKHDLLHKATGWLLREVGKHEEKLLLAFLDQYAPQMPRVMLRYSLEKLPQTLRLKYLNAK
jgi:3-methyladenine DNA glycosylase AlkD